MPARRPVRDQFDREADELDPSTVAGRAGLARLGRRFLRERGDQALGFGPLRVLPEARHDAWILLWTAARRADDALEAGGATPTSLRRRLEGPLDAGLAERCVAAFLEAAKDRAPLRGWKPVLSRALRGLSREVRFTRPRPVSDYWDLLRDRSTPAMIVLDHLLFDAVPERDLAQHARFMAASTQIGDDCRDASQDLARGRCFVTAEEVQMLARPSEPVSALVRRPDFARLRTAWSRQCLEAAAAIAEGFPHAPDREAAARLDALWRQPLEAGQVRATRDPLRLGTPSTGFVLAR